MAYIGIANELKSALKTYTESKGRGKPTHDNHEAFSILVDKVEVIRALFDGFDYLSFEENALKLLPGAMNHILSLPNPGSGKLDGKKRFFDVMAALTKAYTLCSTLDETAKYKKEIAFYSAVKASLSKYTGTDKRRTDEEKHIAMKQIIDNAIVAEWVVDVFEQAGLDKRNVGLLSDEFLDDVRNMKERNLAVELLEKLLKVKLKHA